MSVVPSKYLDRLQFFQDHLETWTENSTAIGTTSAAVTVLGTRCTAARTAFDAQQQAQMDAKNATEVFMQAVDAMNLSGSAIIDQIRAAAKTTGDGVYTLAKIPPPATPSPAGDPGQPYKVAATLDEQGNVSLKWKCQNPSGTTGTLYQVFRTIGTNAMEYLGGSGSKTFTDTSLPAGSSVVVYELQAVRSTGVGPWAAYTVKFGKSGTASVTQTTPTKVAA